MGRVRAKRARRSSRVRSGRDHRHAAMAATAFVAHGRRGLGAGEHRKRAHLKVRERGAHPGTAAIGVQARQPYQGSIPFEAS